MFKKFEVLYSANLVDVEYAMQFYGCDREELRIDNLEDIKEDFISLTTLFTKPSYKERWVVKYRVTWFWLFYTEHKLYLRSRSETSAIAQAKKFALGE